MLSICLSRRCQWYARCSHFLVNVCRFISYSTKQILFEFAEFFFFFLPFLVPLLPFSPFPSLFSSIGSPHTRPYNTSVFLRSTRVHCSKYNKIAMFKTSINIQSDTSLSLSDP